MMPPTTPMNSATRPKICPDVIPISAVANFSFRSSTSGSIMFRESFSFMVGRILVGRREGDGQVPVLSARRESYGIDHYSAPP